MQRAETASIRIIDHWIGNSIHRDDTEPRVSSTNPWTGQEVATVACGNTRTVALAVESAASAQPAWAAMAPRQRGRLLMDLARALVDRRSELLSIECEESGKLPGEGEISLDGASEYFEYYGGVVRAFMGDTIDLGANQHAMTLHVPHGVVAIITPWNGPLNQAARSAAAALAVGNTVVIKPSEYTSSSTTILGKIAAEVGFPPGVLNVVTGPGPSTGSDLVRHNAVRMVSFTGSVNAGRTIAATAAQRLIPVHLELGGKSPNIVFADADLESAVESAATVCVSAGQQCSALSRLLVQDSIHDEFIERVGIVMRDRTPGTRLGPLATPAQFERVLSFFDTARDEGARLVTGGQALPGSSANGGARFVEATLYADVDPSMRLFTEEVFGPVLAATPFRTEQEAIALANESDFGLAASVWTADSSRALRVAGALHVGQVSVNGGALGIDVPFGGFKDSGIGREKGFEALRGYTRVKSIVISSAPSRARPSQVPASDFAAPSIQEDEENHGSI